jgi:hypothetical protein
MVNQAETGCKRVSASYGFRGWCASKVEALYYANVTVVANE